MWVVYMVMVLVLMVMVVDCGQGHLECRRAYISLLLFVCMVTESRHDLVIMVVADGPGSGHGGHLGGYAEEMTNHVFLV